MTAGLCLPIAPQGEGPRAARTPQRLLAPADAQPRAGGQEKAAASNLVHWTYLMETPQVRHAPHTHCPPTAPYSQLLSTTKCPAQGPDLKAATNSLMQNPEELQLQEILKMT